jgi:hypothetical protein
MQVRHERRFADSFRAKNQHVLALLVQLAEPRNFSSTTHERNRESHIAG